MFSKHTFCQFLILCNACLSIMMQLQRLMELRDFCESVKENKSISSLMLDEGEWLELSEIVEVLTPFNKYTVKLQNSNCTLSDFFGFWTTLQLKVKDQANSLKKCLSENMNKYETDLLENPLVICAIYLDPRYQRVLCAEKKETAVLILKTIHWKIKSLTAGTEPPPAADNEVGTDSNSFDGLMQYIDSLSNEERSSADDIDGIEEAIRKFDGNRSTENISPLKYWEKNKIDEPVLYALSQAVHSIAPTQCSVERSFSSLPVVLTARRTRIDDQCLRNILLIKNNPHIIC